MENLDTKELISVLESILFAAGEPVALERLAFALELDRETTVQLLQQLSDRYAYERRGMRIIRMENQYQMISAPEYGETIRRAFEVRRSAKLSQSALEVLTIVAYYQPVTRAYIDQIRGVDSAYTVGLLLERRLIEECGKLQVPGRPRLYRTTKEFLRAFHLSSLEELPEMPGVETDGQLRLGDDGTVLAPEEPSSPPGAADAPENTDAESDGAGAAAEMSGPEE